MTLMICNFKPGMPFLLGTTWWRVLDVDREADTALLVTDKAVCERPYHEKWEDVTWESCDLRKWLNGEYYENTFSEEEKAAINETVLENQDNPEYKTRGGNNTKDCVFLLSIDEANRFFMNDDDRAIGGWWWLRSPGYNSNSAAYVYDGSISASGGTVFDSRAVRPSLKINLKSELFQSMIVQESSQSITVKIPEFIIRKNVLVGVNPDIESAEIPEGVKELAKESFKGLKNLTSVTFPSTLKKIGAEAFSGCKKLQTVSGAGGAVTYGKDVFEYCKNLEYTKDMFLNAGKLCDSFAEHLDVCGMEELAMVRLYQSGKCWEEKLPKLLTAENADPILSAMTKHLQEKRKAIKKPAEAAAEFVRANAMLFSGETLRAFLEMLEKNKMADLSEKLKEDPAVNAVVNGEQSISSGERVCPDGSILYGNHLQKLEPGADIVMGNEPRFWRILELDRVKGTALVIADRAVCERSYHKKWEDVTWETCDLRKWLNGEYYENTFSEEEKAAINETVLENQDNSEYKTRGGNNTKDWVFLLSIDEANRFFENDDDRAIGDWWWLRLPGYNSRYAANVLVGGSIGAYGFSVASSSAVRPAFRINLKSEIFQSLIQKNAEGEEILAVPDLIIRNGTVISARRALRTVELPPYVRQIGTEAFSNCPYLTSVNWNGAVEKISKYAFRGCPELSSVFWSGTAPVIHNDAFYGCPNALLPAEYFCKVKALKECFADYMPDDPDVWAYVFFHAEANSDYIRRMFRRLTKENASVAAEKILDQIENEKTLNNPDVLARFILTVQPWIGTENRKRFKVLLKEKKEFGEYLWLLKYDSDSEAPYGVPAEVSYRLSGKVLKQQLEEPLLERIPSITHVFAAAQDYTGMYEAGYVEDKEYRKGVHKQYEKREKADQLAESMDHAALMEILHTWASQDEKWYAPYAVYADDDELAALIAEMKTWEKDKSLRGQIIRVRGAVFLNDTVTAMRYADSIGQLDCYASLRGEDADSIRDNIISDFGLDERGKKTWTLAGRTITAALQPDLTLALTDAEGKLLKSVPKKGAETEEYAAVSREFSAMKKNIRSTAKTRNDRIFDDFLSGRERPGGAWKAAYLKNPVLRMLARLIVWEQDKKTFVLDENGTARCVDGSAFIITDAPIRVAHPMEMKRSAVEAWQNYFTENGLKQPFEQVWEPVTASSQVKPGRYDGCTIPLYMLMNRDKHGIIMEGQSRITLKDCTAGLKYIEGHHDWINNEFEVTNFRFEKYTRQVNHIVVYLDKGTVAGRIKKDDVSAAQWFDRFTPAQITDFISLALENNAVNVLAQLMEYKNQHFPDVDPMDRFTLDW